MCALFLFFTKWLPLKLCKMCLIWSKKFFFVFKIFSFFVFSFSPPFLPGSHCSRRWQKLNLKVCDVISSLNKTLKTYFIWYLEKESTSDIETWSFDNVLNNPKTQNVLNSPKYVMHPRNSFENKIFWKRIIKKPLKS